MVRLYGMIWRVCGEKMKFYITDCPNCSDFTVHEGSDYLENLIRTRLHIAVVCGGCRTFYDVDVKELLKQEQDDEDVENSIW